MNTEPGTRITLKRRQPNPLFQKWLKKLHNEAKAKNSRLEPMLREALESLSKYPLPLNSGAECAVLKGFDKKLCLHLDKCLEVHRENTGSLNSLDTCSRADNSTPMSVINPNINIQTHSIPKINSDTSPIHSTGTISNLGAPQPSSCNTESNSAVSYKDIDLVCLSPKNNENVLVIDLGPPSPINNVNKNKSKGKKYKPAPRSGAYALLIALLEVAKQNLQDPPYIGKEELIQKAQAYSEESFIRPKPDTHYTAWSNMSRLLTKGLVKKIRNKTVKFALTEEGIALAGELLKDNPNPGTREISYEPIASQVLEERDTISASYEQPAVLDRIGDSVIELEAGSFDIILLIDKNETGGVSKKNDPTVAQFNKYPDLNHEYRSLKVGDFTWIARHRVNKDQELVLPYVVERKRMDDLGASIKDGRFHEQKFRLRKCGLKNVIYMVENYGSNKHVGLPVQHLMQALANTRVQDGFKVHITDSLTNSARFLAMMTKRLTIRYKNKNLQGRNDEASKQHLMSFNYFNKASVKSKPLTVTETFIKLLLQLKGVSVEKALAITAKYGTPSSLIIAYQKCDRSEGETLLANLKYGGLCRNVGPTTSKAIYQLFSNMGTD